MAAFRAYLCSFVSVCILRFLNVPAAMAAAKLLPSCACSNGCRKASCCRKASSVCVHAPTSLSITRASQTARKLSKEGSVPLQVKRALSVMPPPPPQPYLFSRSLSVEPRDTRADIPPTALYLNLNTIAKTPTLLSLKIRDVRCAHLFERIHPIFCPPTGAIDYLPYVHREGCMRRV